MMAFVHIEKCAGTSLKFILRNSFGLRHCDVLPTNKDRIFYDKDLALVRKCYPALRSISGHALKNPSENLSGKLHLYTFLRDPVGRCASHYQYHQQVMKSRRANFDDWIHTDTWRNFQVRKIAGEENLQKAIDFLHSDYFFVGMVEKFEESLAIFKELSPYPIDANYKIRNVAQKNEIKDDLLANENSLSQLEAANDLDKQLVNYVGENLFPGFKKQAEKYCEAREEKRMPCVSWKYGINRIYYKLIYRQVVKSRRDPYVFITE